MNKSQALVIDIECHADVDINTPLYVEEAKIKWIGIYSYAQDKYYEVLIANKDNNKNKLIDFIAEHDTLVSFNGDNFDLPILKNNGLITNQWMKSVDVWKILGNDEAKGCKNRGKLMGYDFKNNSLKAMAEEMGLPVAKGGIDYRIFAKDKYSPEEIAEIKKYLHADIEITKLMFDKLYQFWQPFTELISEKNKNNWSWLKCSIASLVYKVYCNLMDLPEEYGNGIKDRGIGALVIEPTVQEETNIYYVDVVSLYPHIIAMFNLLSQDANNDWHGNDVFKVNGKYNDKEQHKGVKIISSMLKKRAELKKNDKANPMIFVYKLFLNTFYGILRNPAFKHTYNEIAGEDCCRIGQEINRIMQRMFAEKGYKIIAGDTDSNFIKPLQNQTHQQVEQDLQDVVDYINKYALFPQPTFKIAIEHKIDYIMFVKDGDKTLKKNYVYIWSDRAGDKHVEVMGLPVIKSSATMLGKLILDKHILPRMKLENIGKFDKTWFDEIINAELTGNIALIAQEYKCQPYNDYSLAGKHSIWAQISKTYLDGKGGYIKLITNKNVGKVGGGLKYCTVEEAATHGLTMQDIDLGKLMNELAPFMKNVNVKRKSLMEY
jgi:DNA polymerase elongation subunit (family B)